MELLIEILFELIFEGTIELSSNKKVPKIIRYPLIVLIVLFFILVIGGMFTLGIFILKESIIVGILLIIFSLALLILSIKEFRSKYLIEKKK